MAMGPSKRHQRTKEILEDRVHLARVPGAQEALQLTFDRCFGAWAQIGPAIERSLEGHGLVVGCIGMSRVLRWEVHVHGVAIGRAERINKETQVRDWIGSCIVADIFAWVMSARYIPRGIPECGSPTTAGIEARTFEESLARDAFEQHAADRPRIDRGTVISSKQQFWRTMYRPVQ